METNSPHIGWFDRLMAAVTFAEAGEVRTALEVKGLKEDRESPRISKFDRLMTAVAFAEAGEADTALEITGKTSRKAGQKQDRRKSRSEIDHRPRLYA
jgi:hypothetical protein